MVKVKFLNLGVCIFKDKSEYNGEWKDGKMNGKGIFTWPDGRKYEGYYLNDLKHGTGRFEWEGGKIYDGEWKNGCQHGLGKYFFPKDNAWRNGEWIDGKLKNWID